MSQIWFERILRWRKKAQRFLQGRYARFDELNRTLLLCHPSMPLCVPLSL